MITKWVTPSRKIYRMMRIFRQQVKQIFSLYIRRMPSHLQNHRPLFLGNLNLSYFTQLVQVTKSSLAVPRRLVCSVFQRLANFMGVIIHWKECTLTVCLWSMVLLSLMWFILGLQHWAILSTLWIHKLGNSSTELGIWFKVVWDV